MDADRSGKQKVVLYGNCQTAWLRHNFFLAAQSAGMLESYEFVHVQSPMPNALAALEAQLAGAKALLFQITRDSPEPPEHIARLVSGNVFRFPALLFKSFWPFDGHDPRNRMADPDFIGGFCPRGDTYVNKLLQAKTPYDEIFERYMQEDVSKLVNLDRLLELEVSRFRLQERNCDLKFADRIASEFRDKQHFAMVWHPTHPFFLEFIGQIWDFLLLPDIVRDRSRFVLEHGKGMQPHVPIHPSIAEYFGLKWARGNATFDYFDHPMTFADWLRAYIHYKPWPKAG